MPIELPDRTSDQWLDLLRAHDQRAWDDLLRLVTWACNATHGSRPLVDREDAVSQVLIKLINRLKDPAFKLTSIKSYVFRAVANYWKDMYRRQEVPQTALDEAVPAPGPADLAEPTPEHRRLLGNLRECFGELTEQQQQIAQWSVHDCGPTAIAAWLGTVTANNVGVILNRLLHQLRDCLYGKGWDEAAIIRHSRLAKEAPIHE